MLSSSAMPVVAAVAVHGDGDVGQLDAETDGGYDIDPGCFFFPNLPCQFSFPTTQDF